MNFDIWHSYRFLTKGFDQAPFYESPTTNPIIRIISNGMVSPAAGPGIRSRSAAGLNSNP